tara:strand:+ start:190313 stop:190627 length:315 start_codon:yes stop_codon:yes gene_type:complete
MDYEKQEQLIEWFDEFQEESKDFKDLENKPHESEQVAAIIFLHSKLKESEKPQRFFLHGEHDVLLIGQDYDIFEDFTEEDVKIAISLGINISGEYEGFSIYASM